jgi:hypothetical protein
MDTQAADPLAVMTAMTAAVSRQDIETALTYFADTAVVHLPGQRRPMYSERDAIVTWLQRDAAHHTRVEMQDVQVVGNTLTGTSIVSDDNLRNIALPHITGPTQMTVEDGKITSLTFTLDAESEAKINAAEAS